MYKTLLVPVDGRPRSARSIEYAARLARTFDAHVVGLFVKPSAYIPAAVHIDGAGPAVDKLSRQAVEDATREAKAQFDAAVKAAGIPSTEWRVADGGAPDVLALHARYADLVVINQTDPNEMGATHFADAVLLTLGRPAIVVPYTGELPDVPRNVLVCWNASNEAARAVSDALPLLRRAQHVTVMSVDPEPSAIGHGPSPGADLGAWLARHGVKVEVAVVPSGGVDVGNVILSRAFDQSADLIVMGAYGHARLLQVVFGGVTRTLLTSMTVPVLMSH